VPIARWYFHFESLFGPRYSFRNVTVKPVGVTTASRVGVTTAGSV